MIKKRGWLSIRCRGLVWALGGVVNQSKITKRIRWLKRDIQREMQQAYWSYVESIITPTLIGRVRNSQDNQRFSTFIKHCRSDTSGVSLLSDETGNKSIRAR